MSDDRNEGECYGPFHAGLVCGECASRYRALESEKAALEAEVERLNGVIHKRGIQSRRAMIREMTASAEKVEADLESRMKEHIDRMVAAGCLIDATDRIKVVNVRAEQAEEAVRQITRSDMQQTLALKKAEARADGNYQVVEKLRAQLGKAEAEKCPEPSHHATVARQFHRISVLEAELAAAERGIRNAISAKDKNHADYILNESLKRATGP